MKYTPQQMAIAERVYMTLLPVTQTRWLSARRELEPEKRKSLDPAMDAQIEELLREGISCRQIAVRLGCGRTTVETRKRNFLNTPTNETDI